MLKKLSDWQATNHKDDAALAALLGCSRQTVQRLKQAKSMPRRPTLDALKALTGVTPTDCAAHFEEEAERTASASLEHAGAGA